MTKYCPVCESEFQDTLAVCPDDGERLFDTPRFNVRRNQAIDFYVTQSEIEARLIVGILEEREISSQIFRPQISQLPSINDQHFILAVRNEERTKASQVIREAIADGILSSSGVFLEG